MNGVTIISTAAASMPRCGRLNRQDDTGRASASEYRRDVDKRGLGGPECRRAQPLRGPWDSGARVSVEIGSRLCRLPALRGPNGGGRRGGQAGRVHVERVWRPNRRSTARGCLRICRFTTGRCLSYTRARGSKHSLPMSWTRNRAAALYFLFPYAGCACPLGRRAGGPVCPALAHR